MVILVSSILINMTNFSVRTEKAISVCNACNHTVSESASMNRQTQVNMTRLQKTSYSVLAAEPWLLKCSHIVIAK